MMKRPYSDAKKAAIARDRFHVFNQRKAVQINFAAPVPEDVQQRADQMFKRLEPHLGRYKRDQKRQDWRAIFQALEQAAGLEAGCVLFPRNERHEDFRSTRLQLMNAATAEELVVPVLSPRGSPKMSRYVPYGIKAVERTLFVELRERETGEPLPFDPAHPVAAEVQRRLARVNGVNANWEITIQPYDWRNEEFQERKRIRPLHYAVFTNDFKHHGRIYTGPDGHQAYSGESRRTLHFNRRHSVELDYGGLHPRLLYHVEGIRFNEDPYRLWGDRTTPSMRLLAKQLINKAINAPSRGATISACNQSMNPRTEQGQWKTGKEAQTAFVLRTAYREVGVKFSAIYDLARTHHARIGKYFGSDAGMQFLMRTDSKIALNVLYHFASQGIPCLGVHDSFVVPETYAEELRRCMIEFYLAETDFEPVVK